jgi:hypothetical protein
LIVYEACSSRDTTLLSYVAHRSPSGPRTELQHGSALEADPLNGGPVVFESPKAMISGTLTCAGTASLIEADTIGYFGHVDVRRKRHAGSCTLESARWTGPLRSALARRAGLARRKLALIAPSH